MANEPMPVTQAPRALDTVISGGPTVADVYLVMGGGGRWEFDPTGPAEAYFVLSGGRYVIDDGASAHDAFVKQIGTRIQVK